MTQAKPVSLCMLCPLATWDKTKTGRLHPDGYGRCGWKPPVFKIPEAFYYPGFGDMKNAPRPSGGRISRKEVVTECPVYEEVKP